MVTLAKIAAVLVTTQYPACEMVLSEATVALAESLATLAKLKLS